MKEFMKRRWRWCLAGIPLATLLFLCVFLLLCGNNPWPREYSEGNTLFLAVSGEYKTLDPALSYFEHEAQVIDNIVESLFCYEYGKRPYTLAPMLAREMPTPRFRGRDGALLPEDAPAEKIATVEYEIHLKEGIFYQCHPCFALKPDGTPRYLEGDIPHCKSPLDFLEQGTRELSPEDFKVALVRLCDPRLASPIYSTLKGFLLGMDECSAYLSRTGESDYRKVPLKGFEQTGPHSFRLILSRNYPQALYWMAMHFFSPMPQEALDFYRRPELAEQGISLGRWPVGTGAYMLAVNETDSRFVLRKNPYFKFRGEDYPAASGKRLPLVDTVCFMFENEPLPGWLKFQQGYFDLHSIPQESFDTAMSVGGNGALDLSDQMKAKGVSLHSSVRLTTYYYGFNMLDPVFGGYSPEQKKLRQAIAIAIDTQEYITLFLNGRACIAQSIIPAGILGGDIQGPEDCNPFAFTWDAATGKPVRRSIDYARRLMTEAGYPNGIGKDGERLKLHYDHPSAGKTGFVAQFRWLKARLELIGIELVDRGTDQNRMRDKLTTGNWQFMRKAWLADYPDVENFLMLYHSGNAHALHNGRGPNYTNYQSESYDRIFKQLEVMPDSPERLALIRKANRILWEDAPCIWEYHPTSFTLKQKWLGNYHSMEIGNSFLKYYSIDRASRKEFQK